MKIIRFLIRATTLRCTARARTNFLIDLDTMTKRKFHSDHSIKRPKPPSKKKSVKEGSSEEVLLADIKHLLSAQAEVFEAHSDDQDGRISGEEKPKYSRPERFSEIVVKISELSSTGDGLALADTSDHVYVVPFSLPGETVKVKVVNCFNRDHYTLTDFISVIEPAANRNDALVRCPYFAKCSGCQFQMLPYAEQLVHKKTIIEKAYRNFSSLPPELIPAIGDTIGSPLQYGYRTKLTPHFDGPPGVMSRKARRANEIIKWNEVPPIGFMQKGTRKTIDIEDCPIGTDVVRLGLKLERKRVADDISIFRKGATLLLRESTKRVPKSGEGDKPPAPTKAEQESIDVANERAETSVNGTLEPEPQPLVWVPTPGTEAKDPLPYTEEKTCVTDQTAISTEFVDDYIFTNPAGSFFQNNNSILPTFTAYIRKHILGPPTKTKSPNPSRGSTPTRNSRKGSSSPAPASAAEARPITNLIDAYCGSGLFSITLSPLFSHTLGIDIAGASIRSAHANALVNDVSNADFMTADATEIFAAVKFPADETVVVIDPSRKGCDEGFLRQLLSYAPKRVCYVSCNVHTQARDVGLLVQGMGVERGAPQGGGVWLERRETRYRLESLRGFDFFPQTGHVEGVAMLARVD